MLVGDIVGYHSLNTTTDRAISFADINFGLPSNEMSNIHKVENIEDSELPTGLQVTIPSPLSNPYKYMTTLTPEVVYKCTAW